MCCDGPSAPQPSAAQNAAVASQAADSHLMTQAAIQDMQFNQQQEQAQSGLNSQVEQEQLNNMKLSDQRSGTQYDQYTRALPQINQTEDELFNYGGSADQAQAAGAAETGVDQGFKNSLDTINRQNAMMGVNPNSGSAQAALAATGANAGLAKAQAGNSAIQQMRLAHLTTAGQAVNMANGFSSQSMALTGLGGSAGAAGLGAGAATLQQSLAGQNAFSSAMSAGGNMAGSAAAGYGNIFNENMASANYQNQNSIGSSLGQIAGMAMGLQMSDRRLKTNIKSIGKTHSGLPIYTYKYKGTNAPQVGVMADEVEKKIPSAVHTTPSGYKAVDYSKVR
jgi:hypothetical protein